MQKAERDILSTRPLPGALLLEAAARGFEVNCLSFIETESLSDEYTIARIRESATQNRAVIFTSMNAVEAVAAHISVTPSWTVYAIGHSTRQRVEEKLGLSVAGTGDDAAALADTIIASGEKNLLFFCGDIRRETLPVKLREAQIAFEELHVYRTLATPHKVGKEYGAVLFFSPSAVESYFSANKPAESSVLFAIGSTTAAAIRERFPGNIVVADGPGKEALLRRAMHFFETNSKTNIL